MNVYVAGYEKGVFQKVWRKNPSGVVLYKDDLECPEHPSR